MGLRQRGSHTHTHTYYAEGAAGPLNGSAVLGFWWLLDLVMTEKGVEGGPWGERHPADVLCQCVCVCVSCRRSSSWQLWEGCTFSSPRKVRTGLVAQCQNGGRGKRQVLLSQWEGGVEGGGPGDPSPCRVLELVSISPPTQTRGLRMQSREGGGHAAFMNDMLCALKQ